MIIDIIMQYTFARSDNRVDMENFDQAFHNASYKGSGMGVVFKQYPWLLPLMQSMPDWLLVRMDPDMSSFVQLQHVSCSLFLDTKSRMFIYSYLMLFAAEYQGAGTQHPIWLQRWLEECFPPYYFSRNAQ